MDFIEPSKIGFSVYSKSGCPNCVKVKRAIKEKKFLLNEIDCDDYLIDNKEEFITFIKEKMGKPVEKVFFPIVFFDGKFIGGYDETIKAISEFTLSFEDTF